MFSREYLQQSATETGFRPDTLERVLRLERLLGQVRRHPFLRVSMLVLVHEQPAVKVLPRPSLAAAPT